jgi:predicted phosphate transport protein (TIGR00153 family)
MPSDVADMPLEIYKIETTPYIIVDEAGFGAIYNESDYNKRAALVKSMKELENENDKLTHTIFVELGKNFITPFDREDIHSLATALDDIADYIYAAAKKINFYKIEPTNDQGIKKMADAIKESVLSVNRAVLELRNLKNINKVVECVIKINRFRAINPLFSRIN